MTQRHLLHPLVDPWAAAPTVAFIRDGSGFFGWGEAERFDPGTGSDRFERAHEAVARSPGGVGFATFTFDQEEPGSVVIIPEALLQVGPGAKRLVFGAPDAITRASGSVAIPKGREIPGQGDGWQSTMESALDAIRRGEVEKVVVSRILELDFDDTVPIHVVAARLASGQEGSHTFMIDGLVGSSPELLVSKHGPVVRSLSLAGSADGSDPSGPDSLMSQKVAVEHALAADSVEEALSPFCAQLSRLPSTVRAYADIRHMATAFEGTLVPGTRVIDLVASLHPTAAVAGTPTKAAVELIHEIEPHGRGRYTGPVGWLDRDGDGEFAIALRCGELRGSTATLYSGVGLVAGSDAGSELEETKLKLRPMLRALGVS